MTFALADPAQQGVARRQGHDGVPARAEAPGHTRATAMVACRHCGLPVPGGAADVDRAFCCAGCAGAYALIHDLGLDAFYARRDAVPLQAAERPEDRIARDFTDLVAQEPDGTHCLRLRVDGLACGACIWLIETALAKRPEVASARVNLTTRRLTLRWRGSADLAASLVTAVEDLGYRLAPFDGTAADDPQRVHERELLRAMAVAGFASMNIMLLSVSVWFGHAGSMGDATRGLMHWLSALIALPTVLYAGRPFFRAAWTALKAGRSSMDIPISLGVTLTCAVSLWETIDQGHHAYFDGAVMLLFFLLVGRFLDSRARGRARSAAEHLLALQQRPVTVLCPDGTARVMAPGAVEPGATVLVAAGERIGIDGVVADGGSELDASLVTGESRPQPAGPGQQVFAGMVNLSAPLRVTVTACGEGTLLAEIVRLMEAAEQGRARFVALADRIARLYTPVVHTLALATFLAWTLGIGLAWQPALLIAVAVLIITCPCALALAVPAVQVVAAGRLMRGGILLKSPTALERLAKIDTVVFDKTGTLTLGRPELAPPNEGGWTEADLHLAATLARASRHPLSKALCRAAGPGPVADGVIEIPGRGLELAVDGGVVRLGSRAFVGVAEPWVAGVDPHDETDAMEFWLAAPGQAPVRFAFADRARDDAAATVAGLRAAGFHLELLSGDRPGPVARLAAQLGLAEWRAGVDPAGKCARLAELRASGRRVLMVGDGLNDAGALAAADVSLSPASGMDIAQTAADAVFQGDRLAPVVESLRVAKGADRLVKQNLVLTLVYNLCAVPVAMLGFATPLVAAAAMSGSSLVVIANALRLGRGRHAVGQVKEALR